MNNEMIREYVRGRECALLGLGVSNLPLAKMLLELGVTLRIYDKKSSRELGEAAVALEKAGASFEQTEDFSHIEGQLIFRSPGIRPDYEGILSAVRNGAELISEMELFLRLTEAKTLALTGSDGKTTSTTLTGLLLSSVGRTYVGGNIGSPLLDKCGEMTKDDCAVLELSSFQLMTLTDAPECVAITNISPNHLDWHRDMEEYECAKKNIIGKRTRRLVTNADCAATAAIAREYSHRKDLEIILFSSSKTSYGEIFDRICPQGDSKAIYISDGCICVSDGKAESSLLPISEIRIPGKHNVENYMTAIGLTLGCVTGEDILAVARGFCGVEHRLELVREKDGVRYYNSSIDSSPTRTAAALSALEDRSIVLICGGYDKKIPYSPLARAIYAHGGVHTVVLTGDTGAAIKRELELCDGYSRGEIRILEEKDFRGAVLLAHSSALKGDAVLLSPASASFDAFKNFAERGRVFKQIINSLK